VSWGVWELCRPFVFVVAHVTPPIPWAEIVRVVVALAVVHVVRLATSGRFATVGTGFGHETTPAPHLGQEHGNGLFVRTFPQRYSTPRFRRNG
jgi:hypothetical protein